MTSSKKSKTKHVWITYKVYGGGGSVFGFGPVFTTRKAAENFCDSRNDEYHWYNERRQLI